MAATITPQAIPKSSRLRVNNSTKMLQEWADARYGVGVGFYELRLGPTSRAAPGIQLTPALEAALRVTNWYADLIVPTATTLDVIEAKLEPNPSAVGQVLWYSHLVPSTPDLAAYSRLPIRPIVVFGQADAAVTAWARSFGILVELYSPTWLVDYLVRRQVAHGRSNSA